MATDREVTKWRARAEANLAQANRLLSALLFAAKELVSLSDMHEPDDFAHCRTCKTPWPCDTALRIKMISEVFTKAQNDNDKENGS